ncbi:carboxypeptidase-like regulatory domain-containing protein [Mesoflavibacter sp. SCSIO 43206]|uniref:carboxypeptidase-like regulatory domain-containing protein n=1 Tax=Mesoflavibacter sp. SCSIO 43206 TaxID=2779362 RepID=UPI001CA8EBBF|nr:carboxypeptidase-like regulatory domain-containing protein [Mesoflavibacter sp. SCSIO 43206]UAB75580.1 carboxypeptidase-like regulatory domain-containing protein [Mesoflavibacter sp. SCSIO 43206]
MKKILLILLIGISNLTFAQTGTNLSGKIVNEKLNCLFGVKITNLNSGTESISDQNGRYEINATENDTLEFQMIGLTTDKIKVEKTTQTLNLIMMDKDVNCLGAIWTDKQYRKAYRGIEKRLKKLYKTAEKQNVWKNSSCQHRL